MEFGIYIRRERTYPKMLDLTFKAEKLDYQGVYLNDHVHGFADEGKEDYLEAWTAMTGIGVQTTKIRIGQIVLFNSLRNPAFLAKSIATLDNMTNGRYEFLIGAGWNEPEYLGYDLMERGRGMPTAKERVDRFEEALMIIKSMLNNEITDYDGHFWKLHGAINNPGPIQKPMRISVGCKAPRMMKITAKLADGINVSGRDLAVMKELVTKFDNTARKIGKSKEDYLISGFGGINITKDQDAAREQATRIADARKVSVEEVLDNSFVGTPEMLVEKLGMAKEMGINLMIIAITLDENLKEEPLAYFKDEVISNL